MLSFCDNDTCWQRKTCYRWAQVRHAGDISTHLLVPVPADYEPCAEFKPLEPGDKLRPEAGA